MGQCCLSSRPWTAAVRCRLLRSGATTHITSNFACSLHLIKLQRTKLLSARLYIQLLAPLPCGLFVFSFSDIFPGIWNTSHDTSLKKLVGDSSRLSGEFKTWIGTFTHMSSKTNHHHHHHQSLNWEGQWGTTDDSATSFSVSPCSPLPSLPFA